METKSRYEVLSDLENKKRELIKERDGLNDSLIEKKNLIKTVKRDIETIKLVFDRQKQDISREKEKLVRERSDVNKNLDRKEQDLTIKKEDIERQEQDTLTHNQRRLEDVESDAANFEASIKERKETIIELIKSVDESLQRFQLQQK